MSNYKELLTEVNTFIFDYDGVLTNGSLWMMPDGEAVRMGNVKDGYAIQHAIKNGYNIAIISGGNSKSMEQRMAMLKVPHVFLGVKHKIKVFEDLLKEQNIKPENVVYMGDDIPDYEVMSNVGVPCCPADAVTEIKSISKYISHFNGGQGCVRDIIEQVLRVQGKWMNEHSFKW
ncbi:MAG: KdsC family phosphatase [Hyphomicrobiales bacterium]